MLKVGVDKKIRATEFSAALVFVYFHPLSGLGEFYLTTTFATLLPFFTT